MQLFHFPGTRGARVIWAAHEVGAPIDVTLLDVRKGEHKTPEYLARHPHGKVPAAEVAGDSYFESCALALHLAERHGDEGFVPSSGHRRLRMHNLSFYAACELDPVVVPAFLHSFVIPEERRNPELVAEKSETISGVIVPYLSRVLGDQPYLLGDQVTIADVNVGYDLALMGRMGLLDANLGGLLGRLAQRPGFQAAFPG